MSRPDACCRAGDAGGRAAPGRRPDPRRARAQAGLALVTVVVVLVAMALLATPFALSMRNLEAGALLLHHREQARGLALSGVAAAEHHLRATHPVDDVHSPHADPAAELFPPDLHARYPELLPRDDRGALVSVSIEDERGKVHLPSASPALLANLLGGQTVLAADLGPGDLRLALADVRGLSAPGVVLVGDEPVFFGARGEHELSELVRGVSTASLPHGRSSAHAAGTPVLDMRAVLLCQRSWHVQPGAFRPPARVAAVKDVALFSELVVTDAERRRLQPLLTVHGGPARFHDHQRLLGVAREAGGPTWLLVRDGRFFGAGSVVQLDGPRGPQWNLVTAALPFGDHWRLRLLEDASDLRPGETLLARQVREAVNVASAPREVLVALLSHVGRSPVADVLVPREAALLALLCTEAGVLPDDPALARLHGEELSRAGLSADDLATAARLLRAERWRPGDRPVDALAERLAGAVSPRARAPLSPQTAGALADRMLARRPGSHEELAALLDGAVADGLCTAGEREVLLRNAVDPGDAELSGGTAPFAYASTGVFSVHARASHNLPSGREGARAEVRQVLAGGLPGESTRLLDSQRDFEEAAALAGGGRGFASWPRLLPSGKGTAAAPGEPPAHTPGAGTAAPRRAPGDGEPPRDAEEALALGRLGVSRADSLVAGRPGASDDRAAGRIAPEPVRSPLPHTLHFDEGAPGLLGATPDGLDLRQGPLRLSAASVRPPIVHGGSGLLSPFAVELWFTPHDVDGRAVLFDAGSDALEDRVLLSFERGELLLRVSDGGMADLAADVPAGRAGPAGEIRYAFDDGLPLLAGTPYHVLAFVGGSRDALLALFVDGVPRGRRTFSTRLVADLGAAGSTAPGPAQGGERVRVESTHGFPSRGVLRIGQEVLEYVDTTDEEFLVRPAGAFDPFGGRARRGTVGRAHEAGERVELLGYSTALQSEAACAGSASLAGRLGRRAVAEVDPGRAQDALSISVSITGTSEMTLFPLGTGLDLDATTIPVRGAGGTALAGAFSERGGHALLFCDYGNTELVGKPFDPLGGTGSGPVQIENVPSRTDRLAWIGGAEVIRYEQFDGATLRGCRRAGGGIPVSVGPVASQIESAPNTYVAGSNTTWRDPRAFVTTFSPEMRSALTTLPEEARVLVVPISVALEGAGDVAGTFHPFPSGGEVRAGYLAQIGLDFPDGGDGGTEWIRWNTPTANALVRDDPLAVGEALTTIAQSVVWRMDQPLGYDLAERIDRELRFRAQGGTPNADHADGETVLPVHAFAGWGAAELLAASGLPGRHDRVTLMGDDGAREQHDVNHAVWGDRDWPGSCLAAFRDEVVGDFLATPEDVEQSYPTADRELRALLQHGGLGERLLAALQVEDTDALLDAVRPLTADSRLVTRLLKAPSGELPALPPGVLHAGETFDGRPASQATIDELRLHVPDAPAPPLPAGAALRLAADLEHDEEQVLELAVDALLLPHGVLRRGLLGAERLELLRALPQGGGLLMVGEEVVAYAGLDPDDTGAVFLTGRGLYGSRRARHLAGESVLPLLFWPASPLVQTLSESDALLAVSHPGAFPAEGGLLLVGEELLEYDARADAGLLLPEGPGGRAALRGRFGTTPARHPPGTLVRWMPQRVRDRGALAGLPERHALPLAVRAPGAFVSDVVLAVEVPDPSVELAVAVLCDGAVDDAPVRVQPPREPGSPSTLHVSPLRHADELLLDLSVRWLPGAFDPRRHASNGWKVAPRVDTVLVRHVQPTVVLEHEEWR